MRPRKLTLGRSDFDSGELGDFFVRVTLDVVKQNRPPVVRPEAPRAPARGRSARFRAGSTGAAGTTPRPGAPGPRAAARRSSRHQRIGDARQPGRERRAPFEAVEAPAGANPCLLDAFFGLRGTAGQGAGETGRGAPRASGRAPGKRLRLVAPGNGRPDRGPLSGLRSRPTRLEDLLEPFLRPVLIPRPARADAVGRLEGADRLVHVAAVARRNVRSVLEREDDRPAAVGERRRFQARGWFFATQ